MNLKAIEFFHGKKSNTFIVNKNYVIDWSIIEIYDGSWYRETKLIRLLFVRGFTRGIEK
jgi:hypothetical protein